MAIVTEERLQETLSLALEDRSDGYQDLVSNSNVLLMEMKRKGMWKSYSGPSIRERLLYAESGTYLRYSGPDYLSTTRRELINDAEFEPKMGAVSVVLTMEEILKTNGRAELKSRMGVHIEAAEQELQDEFCTDLHSAGSLSNQIGGLQKAIPTTPTNAYGGISRSANTIWRTTTYDIHSFTTDEGVYDKNGSAITQFDAASAQQVYRQVGIKRSRGKKGPDLILASTEHYTAYANATEAIQRINDETALGKLGFQNLRHYSAGRSIPVVLEGGIGSAMPSNVSYVVDSTGICFRYHPERNFSKIGGKRMPVNQDMVVQHIGFMGELTLKNPIHMAKVYDSDPTT